MCNMMCALHKAEYMQEDVERKEKKPFVYESVAKLPAPLSLDSVKGYCRNKNGRQTGSGFRLIESDDVLLETLTKVIESNTKPFTQELKGMFYVEGHKAVQDWLVKNKSHVRVLHADDHVVVSPVCARLVYSKTYAKFSFVTGMSEDGKALAKQVNHLYSAESIVNFLEKVKDKWAFIPLVVEEWVNPVKMFDDGFEKVNYLGYNLLNMDDFEKDYANWLAQGFRVKKDVWYTCCKSKKVGRYLKRNTNLSPRGSM